MKFWYFSVKIQYICTVRYGTVPVHRNKPAISFQWMGSETTAVRRASFNYVSGTAHTGTNKVHDISQTNVSPSHRSGDELSVNHKLYELA